MNNIGEKMKKLTFVLLALLVGVVACNQDTASQNSDENMPTVEAVETASVEIETLTETASTTEESMITPADLSEEAQNTMYQIIFDYNKCMLASRLTATQNGQSVQQAANDIMSSCESHMDELARFLLSHNVNQPLVAGMTKKMRSRAARKLMMQGMNNMAAQAAAASNADKMETE